MKRATPIFFAILLGAAATAIGMGIFLKLANDDRARLGAEIGAARAEAMQALKEKERIANEANKKVAAANDEVTKAQGVLQALEEEQRLLASAKQLLKPPARDTRNWQSAISVPLGVSILVPPGTVIGTDDPQSLTAAKRSTSSTTSFDTRWFSLTRNDERAALELFDAIATGTARSYLVNGRLLIGKVGTLSTGGPLAVFRVRQAASSTHLLWIKNPGTLGYGDGIERLLGTMEFAQ